MPICSNTPSIENSRRNMRMTKKKWNTISKYTPNTSKMTSPRTNQTSTPQWSWIKPSRLTWIPKQPNNQTIITRNIGKRGNQSNRNRLSRRVSSRSNRSNRKFLPKFYNWKPWHARWWIDNQRKSKMRSCQSSAWVTRLSRRPMVIPAMISTGSKLRAFSEHRKSSKFNRLWKTKPVWKEIHFYWIKYRFCSN